MPQGANADALAWPVVFGLGVVLIAWYLAGNELMRRRAHRLAVWTKRAVDPFGGTQSIRWLGNQAFRLEVEGARAPFRMLMVTGLVEAWDVPFVWAWNRLHGRRDMVQLQVTLRQQPMAGLEIFRPSSVLAGDARRFAQQEGWQESALEDLRVATPGTATSRVAADLLRLVARHRVGLVRLAVRRGEPHVLLALNVPAPAEFEPRQLRELLEELVETVLAG